MGKKWGKMCLLSAVLMLLGGCFFQSPDDLYAVPKAPEDFKNLQAKIDEVLNAGAEYAAPVAGSYTQTVQLRDLDGDGSQEAIVFFRMTAANAERPLKIYIFRQRPDDTFQVQTIIEGDSSAIHSIAYEDLGGDQGKELVVSWQYSNKVYLLSAYAIHGEVAEEILQEPQVDYAILDLDKDNRKEIVILNVLPSDGAYQADFFDFDEERGRMLLRDSARMSQDIKNLSETRPLTVGLLRDNEPALFVTSNMSAGVVTDIFAWRDQRLVNITLNEDGISQGTYRLNSVSIRDVGVRDINRDSIMELPRPMAFPDPRRGGADDNFWSIQWVQYDIQGVAHPVYTTYYNGEDGWYLVLPETWEPLIDLEPQGEKLTLSRRDVANSGERGVVFSLWDGSPANEPKPFLVIYKLTGPNRESRSKLGSRFVLTRESDVVYAGELLAGGWESGLTVETLPEHFRLIQPD